MRRHLAHLRQVDWTVIRVDGLAAVLALATSLWFGLGINNPPQFGRLISGAAGGYALLLFGACLWEIARPESKQRAAETKRHQDEIDEYQDRFDEYLDEIQKLTGENADLNGRIQDLTDQLIGVEA